MNVSDSAALSAYEDLMAHERRTQALDLVAGRLAWDQETMMPQGSAAQRAEEIGALRAVIHARRTDPRISEWLERAEPDTLDEVARAQTRHIRRSHERLCRVPGELASALASLASRAQGQWAEARAADDFKGFAPVLEQVVALKREEGAALADGGDVYDALLDDFEPGASAEGIDACFARMRPGLVALREAALDRVEAPALRGRFDEAGQLTLAKKLAIVFGYDMDRGRLDKAVHPFSSGSGTDVRITTRCSPDDPFDCLYSTIHETGHACYEQAVMPDYAFTPVGRGVSMGVHESQSRLYENQLGRSRPFCHWLYGQMRDTFGDPGAPDEEAFYAAVNRLHRGYIRTEADEVQYNLQIMLRFDLERALVSGDLAVRDLEAAWNDRFEADFGYAVPCASLGCLQDVHWSVGLFGYFPTYTLGNIYAGVLHQALRRAVPDLDSHLAQGDPGPATAWLRDNVQRHGGLHEPRDLIERACGTTADEGPLMSYLSDKFGTLHHG